MGVFVGRVTLNAEQVPPQGECLTLYSVCILSRACVCLSYECVWIVCGFVCGFVGSRGPLSADGGGYSEGEFLVGWAGLVRVWVGTIDCNHTFTNGWCSQPGSEFCQLTTPTVHVHVDSECVWGCGLTVGVGGGHQPRCVTRCCHVCLR